MYVDSSYQDIGSFENLKEKAYASINLNTLLEIGQHEVIQKFLEAAPLY